MALLAPGRAEELRNICLQYDIEAWRCSALVLAEAPDVYICWRLYSSIVLRSISENLFTCLLHLLMVNSVVPKEMPTDSAMIKRLKLIMLAQASSRKKGARPLIWLYVANIPLALFSRECDDGKVLKSYMMHARCQWTIHIEA